MESTAEFCAICGAPAELIELHHGNRKDCFCGWSCLMVYGAGKERDLRLFLVGLAEQHSSQLRAALTRRAVAESGPRGALDALDEILHAIRVGS